ncbi:MAG: hypothetical protein ACXVCP_01925 [Bdellovibrio sp.]
MKFLGLTLLAFLSQTAVAAETSTIEVMKIETVSTSKTSIEDKKPSKWSYSLDSEFYINQEEQKVRGSDARLTSLHWASAKFAYDSSTVLKLVPIFELNYIPSEKDRAQNVQDEIKNEKNFGGARFSDPYVAYVKKAGTVSGSKTMTTEVRYYIPASEVSQEKDSVGILRLDYTLPWTVGNWELGYYLNPRLHMQSQNSVEDNPSGMDFRQFGYGTYHFSDSLSSYAMVGHQCLSAQKNFLFNDVTKYILEVGATQAFSKNVSVTLYVDNIFVAGQEDIKLFASAKNDFTLATSLNF